MWAWLDRREPVAALSAGTPFRAGSGSVREGKQREEGSEEGVASGRGSGGICQ